MNILIDTCVIIDALQKREPFSKDAQKIFLLSANHQVDGFVTAKSITDIYYLTHRYTHNDKDTRNVISKICTLFGVLDTSSEDIHNAIFSEISDFEDAVMAETAFRCKMDFIVTRNIRDYVNSKVSVCSPTDLISTLLMYEGED